MAAEGEGRSDAEHYDLALNYTVPGRIGLSSRGHADTSGGHVSYPCPVRLVEVWDHDVGLSLMLDKDNGIQIELLATHIVNEKTGEGYHLSVSIDPSKDAMERLHRILSVMIAN